jgi:hypothetical protein
LCLIKQQTVCNIIALNDFNVEAVVSISIQGTKTAGYYNTPRLTQWLMLCKFQGKSHFTLEPDQPRHVCPTTRVIAQQYFFAAFSSLPFHSRNEKFF